MLAATLGPEVTIAVEGRALVLRLDPELRTEARRADWERSPAPRARHPCGA